MRRILWLVVGIGGVVAVLAASAPRREERGQITRREERGRIEGVIRDGNGLAIPGVAVVLSRTNPPQRRRAVTEADGRFRFQNLARDTYELVAQHSGFTDAFTLVTLGDRSNETLALVMYAVAPGARDLPPVRPAPSGEAAQADAFSVPLAVPAIAFSARMSAPLLFNTEAYDRIEDFRWADARLKPLSTFSIDVDTASYANVRRILHGGTLPPKDAVRIEELINYFSYDYPEPRDGKPFSVTTALAESPWHPGYRLALVGLQAHRMSADRLPPRNLVFLIDVSGSMQVPNKLPLVKASLAMLAQNLTARDHLAIVVYAGAAGLVLPPTRGDDRSTILEALGRLEAGGSTNGAEGLLLAYRTVGAHFSKGGVNRVILATDGDFNVGTTSEGELVRLIESKRDTGIALSVLGFGMGNLKDATLEKLADKGNGNYFYIDDLNEARKVLVEEAGGTLVTVAKDVKVQVEFNPAAVAAYRLIGYENRALEDGDFNDDRKDAGDLGAGQSVTALYEIVPVGQHVDLPTLDPLKYQRTPPVADAGPGDETMTVKVRYQRPEGSASALMTVPVSTRVEMTPALGFAAAVASFGMQLRDSEFKGSASFEAARHMAEIYRGDDTHGHRAEFARLIGLAESLGQSHERVPGKR